MGFNMLYPFSLGDLRDSAACLANYLEKSGGGGKIPWQDLRVRVCVDLFIYLGVGLVWAACVFTFKRVPRVHSTLPHTLVSLCLTYVSRG